MRVKCLCWNCGREILDTDPIYEINEELWCEKCANPHENDDTLDYDEEPV